MSEFSAAARVPATHPCLPGHFPGRPLVPAVVLLDCAARALREQLGGLQITAVRTAKFLRPVEAEQPIALHFNADAGRGRARFRMQVDGQIAAQGEFAFVLI